MQDISYTRLPHFFGAYFHQDWNIEGVDGPELIRNYRRDVSIEEAFATAKEIDLLLDAVKSDESLCEHLYRRFGCCYDPRPDLGGPAVREWLQEVSKCLRA